MNSRLLYRRLLGYVKPHRRVFAAALVAMALLALTEPLLPALLKPLVDGSFLEQNDAERLFVPLLIVGLFVLRGLLGYAGQVGLAWVANRVVMDLRAAMFRRLVELPTAFYDRASPGALLSKLGYDAAQVAQASSQALTEVVKDGLAVLGLLAWMIWVDWRLALTVLLVGPPIVASVLKVSERLRTRSRRLQESMAAISQAAEEAISGQEVVKVFGGQDYEAARFGRAIESARKNHMKVVMAAAANVPIIQVLLSVGIATMVYVAATLAATERLSVGEFVSFFAAMAMLLPPIKRLTGTNQDIQRGLAAAESVFALLDEPVEVDRGTVRLERARGALSFRKVRFAFEPDRPEALVDIDLEVPAGATVALVGASGAGKSTLASLVPRLRVPTSGQVLLDGIDLQEIDLASLRANVALVGQDVVLFDDTVRNNIAYGAMRQATEEQVLAAARAARVMEFAEDLPQGLDTPIGENGARLSGGQRQRLAIARALLKDAPVLIFDEATSALDTASERYIQAALETLRRGRTCLVIAHRLSTVESADRIVVLEQGRLVESGTHAELIARGGAYAALHRVQLGAPAHA